MPKVSSQHVVDAPVEDVWESWADFGGIAKFHPGIKGSHSISGSPASGLGAERQCDLTANGKQYVRERVTKSVPMQEQVIDIYEGTVPLKSATARLRLAPIGSDKTKVMLEMEFKPGMGPIGWLMSPMMKMKFKSTVEALLKSNGEYVTKGVQIAR
ncbi:MAG: SRPBCC family protein [Thalassovita sp.]